MVFLFSLYFALYKWKNEFDIICPFILLLFSSLFDDLYNKGYNNLFFSFIFILLKLLISVGIIFIFKIFLQNVELLCSLLFCEDNKDIFGNLLLLNLFILLEL